MNILEALRIRTCFKNRSTHPRVFRVEPMNPMPCLVCHGPLVLDERLTGFCDSCLSAKGYVSGAGGGGSCEPFADISAIKENVMLKSEVAIHQKLDRILEILEKK